MNVTTPGRLRDFTQDARGLDLYFEHGRQRIALLAPGLVRVRFTPEQDFAPRRSWAVAADDSSFAPFSFMLRETDAALELHAGPLQITVSTGDGQIALADQAGRFFALDRTPVAWEEVADGHTGMAVGGDGPLPTGRARVEVRLSKQIEVDEVYYGFGQRIGLLDRSGRVLTNWTVDPIFGHGRGHDNLYQAHPFFLAQRPGLAWGCFLNSTWFSQFDCGYSQADQVTMRTLGGELDYYLLYGPTPAEVVEKLTRLTGRPALPPQWALGYHQSRWGYKSEHDVREVVAGFQQHDIPLDAIHLDIDYMHGYRDFTFDSQRFPNPGQLIGELDEQGVRVVTIIDPGVKDDQGNYAVADEGVARGLFVTNPDGSLFVGYCWPDAALFPDFAQAATREWWGRLHADYVSAGVAGIWNDMNEPAIFDRPFSEGEAAVKVLPMPLVQIQGDPDEPTIHAEIHNVYGYLMNRASYEGLRRLRPAARPWLLTRSGYTGIQRYAAAWMGDNNSWWEHLEASLPQLMSMGLCGVPFVGVDVGGFFDNCSPELYARWVMLGAFYPFMRTHTHNATSRQEPWSFGSIVEAIARDAIRLRYRLLPYLYTLAHQAARSGAPLFRPLSYEFPDDPATLHIADQVAIGPSLLLAPITRPGQRYRIVYLPQGRWHDWWSGQVFDGPQHLAVEAPLDRIPLFVRGGSLLPLGNLRRNTNEPLRELTLAVFASSDGSFTLIEDAGDGYGYAQGEIAETTASVQADAGRVTVTIAARAGSYTPPARAVQLVLHLPARPIRLTSDGAEADGWQWDEASSTARLNWNDDGQAHKITASTAG